MRRSLRVKRRLERTKKVEGEKEGEEKMGRWLRRGLIVCLSRLILCCICFCSSV